MYSTPWGTLVRNWEAVRWFAATTNPGFGDISPTFIHRLLEWLQGISAQMTKDVADNTWHHLHNKHCISAQPVAVRDTHSRVKGQGPPNTANGLKVVREVGTEDTLLQWEIPTIQSFSIQHFCRVYPVQWYTNINPKLTPLGGCSVRCDGVVLVSGILSCDTFWRGMSDHVWEIMGDSHV